MSIWTFLGGIFHTVKIKLAPIMVGILQVLKGGETSGILPAIAKVLSPITAGLSVTVNNALTANINNALAVFLGIEALPSNPTTAQLDAFGILVLTTLEGKKATQDVAGQVNVQLGALLYTAIANTIGADKIANLKVTVGQITIDIEGAYTTWIAEEAAAGTPVVSSAPAPTVAS
jgi:hypothetical protein